MYNDFWDWVQNPDQLLSEQMFYLLDSFLSVIFALISVFGS
jgi:hypothetical protein